MLAKANRPSQLIGRLSLVTLTKRSLQAVVRDREADSLPISILLQLPSVS